MAAQNGIITATMKSSIDGALSKVNEYPTLNQNANMFLNGAGNWVTFSVDDATSATGGLLTAADKAFIDALKSGSLANPTTNSLTGALEYTYSDTVIYSVPVASAE